MKMKIKTGILIALVFLLPSCGKWLDVKLPNIVDERDLFSTVEGFHEALAGVYSALAEQSLYGGRLTMEYIDLYAQYYRVPTDESYLEHQRYDYDETRVKAIHSTIWRDMYHVIGGANNIIRWAKTNRSTVLSESEYNQFVGEATAIRAFVHFDLVRMFCPDVKQWGKEAGIPYNKTFGVSLPPQYTVAECVQLVLNDLAEAEKLLAEDPIAETAPYTIADKNEADKYVARMNLYAVKALKARLHLMRAEFAKAIEAAEEVVGSGKFRLLEFASVDAADQANVDMLFSDEHIFSLRNKDLPEYSDGYFTDKDEDEGRTQLAPLAFRSPSPVYDANNDDQRYVKWFVPSEEETDEVRGGTFRKYTVKNTDNYSRKMPVVKLSEIYLILAESYMALNPDDGKALEYINELRGHRIRNNVPWTYLSRDLLVAEMRREYLGEGQMWYAYKRLNLGIPVETLEGIIAPDNSRFVFPMPDNEIENGHRTHNYN